MPWLWALLLGGATVARVHRELARERREWTAHAEDVHRARRLRIREGKYDPPALPVHAGAGVRRDLEARRTLEWQEGEAEEARRALSEQGSRWARSHSLRRGPSGSAGGVPSPTREDGEVARPGSDMTSREGVAALSASRVETSPG